MHAGYHLQFCDYFVNLQLLHQTVTLQGQDLTWTFPGPSTVFGTQWMLNKI